MKSILAIDPGLWWSVLSPDTRGLGQGHFPAEPAASSHSPRSVDRPLGGCAWAHTCDWCEALGMQSMYAVFVRPRVCV